jgi:hypothetical protein
MKSNEVSRSPLADSLTAQLGEIRLKLDELSKENSLGADKIKDYCAELRNDVQLSSEQLIESIKAHNLELVEHVNAYEKNALLDFNKENATQLDGFIQETREFQTKWLDYLKQFKLDEHVLKLALNEASKYLEKINKENDEVLVRVFNDGLIQFKKNPNEASSSTIGKFIKADKKRDSNKSVCLDELDLSNMPTLYKKQQPMSVKLLNDGKISAAYRANDLDDIGIAVFDSYFNLLHERICKTGRNFSTFELNALTNNSIILVLTIRNKALHFYNNKSDDEETFEDFTKTESIIKLFDDKLKKLKKSCLDSVINCIDTFENKLFCVVVIPKTGCSSIYVYDENLVISIKIGQYDPNTPFFIPNAPVRGKFNKVHVCESYFVFRDQSEIIFLDRNSGWVKRRFKFDASDFLLSSETNRILAYDKDLKQVVSYDFEGNSETQMLDVDTSNENIRVQLVDCLNDKLLFLGENLDCLFISRN